MIRHRAACCSIIAFGLASAAGTVHTLEGQVPVTPRFAVIVGVVDDSLRRGPLAGATVVAIGSRRTARTNARGEFVLDSLEPGEVRLGVRHPLLDTLGMTILSGAVQLTAGQRMDVGVSTTTFAALRDRVCVRGGAVTGPAVLYGRVLEADSDAPIPSVSLSLVYQDVAAGDARDRVRQARSREDGSFAICGLPESITGTLQAQLGGVNTAELPVVMKDERLGTAILTFSASKESLAVLTGRVINKAGEPVEGAQVAVSGTSTIGLTRADGTFSLTGLPSGTLEAVVRKIGFAPESRVVALTKREPRRVNVVLASAQVLAAVRVEGKLDVGLQRAGFLDRKKFAGGSFITPEEIARRKPELFTDLLQAINGFRVLSMGNGRVVQPTRNTGGGSDGCINVFIDRTPFQVMAPGDLDMALRMGDVGAVEAYPSATNTPAEFQVPGKACATILVWSRTRLGRP